MFIYKERHRDVRRIYNRRTRTAGLYSCKRERYNCVKYRKSPYHKGSLLWDELPEIIRNSATLSELKKKD